ncbi:HD domain-containing phosphohydrolase [Enterovibrio nigricans]|uniref:HD-GYP domain, c-di-GMP phosphodiesterase class II (Or its inactivated variant) n=1 Tax=Enterovibrio nigricans DSM 22720 TaxID=1121868 RepID=A0A1T4UCB2_9GAMM|nr:HD domain-containing phosphohydrolase [Enterovibrio nigricans]SKA50354.1 HD-GYP domain, c-di-GMP phosphodiesterase class II (or its inactivated variant) [Enterovibrio nigricans DSM 22720]
MLGKKNTLQLHIASIFFIVVSVLSLILIILSYQNSKALNEQLARERTSQNAEQVKLAFEKKISPVLTALETLAVSDFGHTLDASNDENWLASVNAIMDVSPDVLAIYVGYEDESSAFIRSTRPAFMRSQFSTPDNAYIMVDINQSNGDQVRTYYDDKLEYIGEKSDKISYLPTTRPWYKDTPDDGTIYITDPYFYLFIKRMGITISKRIPANGGVLAADITLATLNEFLTSLPFSGDSQVLLFDDNGTILAQNGVMQNAAENTTQDIYEKALESSPLNNTFSRQNWSESSQTTMFNDALWRITLVNVAFGQGDGMWLATAIPEDKLIGTAIEARNNQIFISFAVLGIGMLLILWASRRIAAPLRQLNQATLKIRNLDFSGVKTPDSTIQEVRELSDSISMMSETISDFLGTLHRVSHNQNFESLLTDMVSHCQKTSDADYVLMWAADMDDRDQLSLVAHVPEEISETNIDIFTLLDAKPDMTEALENQRVYAFTPSEIEKSQCQLPAKLKRAWVLPLHNRDKERVGFVFIGFNHSVSEEQEEKVAFIQEFLGFASLIKENWDHIAAQKNLFKSFVEMFASAIDTKSPYTGGHCQRVPELTFMLAEEVSKDNATFPDFSLNDNSREALYFAAWLHDCGKVTTPEYVVDKATKLETIYNRIHEIRMRFEVLKRDADIAYWQKKCRHGVTDTDWNTLQQTHQQLDDDFAFVAQCNIGGEFMDDSSIERLQRISEMTWERTLDDSLGLSWEEEDRRKRRGENALPSTEKLLNDRVDHEIHWMQEQRKHFDNWEFKLPVPSLQYNRGEIYNLGIRRGTLNDEERFKINDHIIQTITMLRKLPYPEHLKRVPEIAGGHHEKLDGKGYPYGLDENDLPIDARIMAVADIFEALTASDRPYKKAKTLSEALKILAFMAKDKHIDPKLFVLFIEQKIYQKYANAFLPTKQHDDVDEQALLNIVLNIKSKHAATKA